RPPTPPPSTLSLPAALPISPPPAIARGARASRGLRRLTGLRAPGRSEPVLSLRGVWHELHDGPAILRGATLSVRAGESVALMGRSEEHTSELQSPYDLVCRL